MSCCKCEIRIWYYQSLEQHLKSDMFIKCFILDLCIIILSGAFLFNWNMRIYITKSCLKVWCVSFRQMFYILLTMSQSTFIEVEKGRKPVSRICCFSSIVGSFGSSMLMLVACSSLFPRPDHAHLYSLNIAPSLALSLVLSLSLSFWVSLLLSLWFSLSLSFTHSLSYHQQWEMKVYIPNSR